MSEVLILIAQFLAGLVLIIKGADWLTDGAADVARRLGIPTLVVGMTVVAMGSSMPELVVSVVSALRGNSDIALGNVVGSNIFNILAIMSITALVRPIVASRGNVRNDVPFVVLSSIVVGITALDTLFGDGAKEDSISRTDGLLMLSMFLIFLSYTLAIAKNNPQPETEETDNTEEEKKSPAPLWKCVMLIIVGLAGLLLGGEWLVSGASGMAVSMGLSQAIVALTIVSAGTSAPELAASVVSARKGDTDMALGNVVGSCVFNVFFVLGTSAAIHPIGATGITLTDMLVLLSASMILWVVCRYGKAKLTMTRSEGFFMLLLAIGYYAWLVVREMYG